MCLGKIWFFAFTLMVLMSVMCSFFSVNNFNEGKRGWGFFWLVLCLNELRLLKQGTRRYMEGVQREA